MGTFVNANSEGRDLGDLVVLPRYVLRAGNYVWVVDDSMRLRNRQVTTLRTGGERVYVSAGLENGDLVSLTSLDASFAGALVSIRSTSSTDQREGQSQPETTPPPGPLADDGEEISAAGGAAGAQ